MHKWTQKHLNPCCLGVGGNSKAPQSLYCREGDRIDVHFRVVRRGKVILNGPDCRDCHRIDVYFRVRRGKDPNGPVMVISSATCVA